MKQRVITGVLGLCLFFAILFLYDTYFFNMILSAVATISVYELMHAYKLDKYKPLLFISCAFSIAAPLLIRAGYDARNAAVIVAFLAFILEYSLRNYNKIKVEQIAVTFFITIAFTFSLLSFIYIRDQFSTIIGLYYTLIIFACSWGADSGAYFAGRFFGKKKLSPNLSPNKTVEGVYGGVISCLLFATIITVLFHVYAQQHGVVLQVNYVMLAITCVVCSIIGVMGDLFASMIKRQCEIKDFGHIMPGHGGLVDRFDSTFFITPVFFVLIQFVQIAG